MFTENEVKIIPLRDVRANELIHGFGRVFILVLWKDERNIIYHHPELGLVSTYVIPDLRCEVI